MSLFVEDFGRLGGVLRADEDDFGILGEVAFGKGFCTNGEDLESFGKGACGEDLIFGLSDNGIFG